jgi:hypothetical protein
VSADLHLAGSPAIRALINSTSCGGMSRLYCVIMSSNIISDASSCCQFLSLGKNPAFLSLDVSVSELQYRKRDSQRLRNVCSVPHVAPWTVAQVMTKAGQLDTLDIAIGDAELGLGILEMYDHLAGQIGDSCVRVRHRNRSLSDKCHLGCAQNGCGMLQARRNM